MLSTATTEWRRVSSGRRLAAQGYVATRGAVASAWVVPSLPQIRAGRAMVEAGEQQRGGQNRSRQKRLHDDDCDEEV